MPQIVFYALFPKFWYQLDFFRRPIRKVKPDRNFRNVKNSTSLFLVIETSNKVYFEAFVLFDHSKYSFGKKKKKIPPKICYVVLLCCNLPVLWLGITKIVPDKRKIWILVLEVQDTYFSKIILFYSTSPCKFVFFKCFFFLKNS